MSKVVSALDLTIEATASGNNAAFSQAANQVATSLGMESDEYKIWLRLNPNSVQETYQQGKTKAKSNARTNAAAECRALSPSNEQAPVNEEPDDADPAFTISQEAIDFLRTDIEAHADDKRSEIAESIESVECDIKAGEQVEPGHQYECVAMGDEGGTATIEVTVTAGSRPSTFFDWKVVGWKRNTP